MGIESDQVVYEYLSRVGDLAQQQQLPSATRMRLVSELRDEIDRRRARAPIDSPLMVRRILARMGSPDEVVAAAGTPGDVPDDPPAAVPSQRAASRRNRDAAPAPRPAADAAGGGGGGEDKGSAKRSAKGSEGAAGSAGSAGSVEGADAAQDTPSQTDWWRVGAGADRPGVPSQGAGRHPDVDLLEDVPGFVGGVEVPELLDPRRAAALEKDLLREVLEKERAAGAGGDKPGGNGKAPDGADAAGAAAGTAGVGAGAAEAEGPGRAAAGRARWFRKRQRLRPASGWSNPLLLLAAALLVTGAVIRELLPLALGWLIVYLSRRLGPTETKWAVLGLPGTVAAGWLVWLWGRSAGRWGDPIAEGQMRDALAETWPWALRAAALASAAYLFWRSQRLK